MTKRTTTGALLVIGALVAAACGADGVLPSEPDLALDARKGGNRANRVEVCHFRSNGKYKKIRVSENGAQRHLERHDRDEPAVDGACPPRTPKVPVCHRGKVKMVREFTKKYDRHLDHGDTLGNCEVAVAPTIPVTSSVFTPLFGGAGLLSVTFSSSDCLGVGVTYQIVGVQDGLVKAAITASGDGPHTISPAFITPVDPNTDFQVRGLCDNGVALSAAFTK